MLLGRHPREWIEPVNGTRESCHELSEAVEPLDVPAASDIPGIGPLGDGVSLNLDGGEAVLGSDGLPVGVRIGPDGVRIEDRRTPAQQRQDRETLERVEDGARDAVRAAQERASEAAEAVSKSGT